MSQSHCWDHPQDEVSVSETHVHEPVHYGLGHSSQETDQPKWLSVDTQTGTMEHYSAIKRLIVGDMCRLGGCDLK